MLKSKNHNIIRSWWRSVDQPTVISLLILFAFSIMLVTTSGAVVANRIGLVDNYFSSRQLAYLLVASFVVIFVSLFEKKWIRRFAIIGFVVNLLMLVMVKFFGYEVKGATRWISIGSFSYQPSEFIKPFFAVATGWILSLKYQVDFPSFQVCGILYIIVAFLLIIQPDFGMLVVITAVFGIQLFIAGLPSVWIFIASFASIFGVMGAYLALPHVAKRINNFLDPEASGNYQVSKSIMAFEHGGIYGVGPGEGTVKQHLPDSHTDFIFAVAGEEFGAIICIIMIGVFCYIVTRTLLRLINETDKFVQFACAGIIAQFGLQAGINIGVNLNLLPTKGMTLPFISYGGSSTLAISIGIGMLLGLTKRKTTITKYKVQEIEI